MTQTILDFETALYQEHLEEASFLYEQRLTLFDDPEITWLDIENFEERFEAHIDALVIGEEPALKVCKTQAGGNGVKEEMGSSLLLTHCDKSGRNGVKSTVDPL